MADREFEEFRQYFEQLPQHIKAPSDCYITTEGEARESRVPVEEPIIIREEAYLCYSEDKKVSRERHETFFDIKPNKESAKTASKEGTLIHGKARSTSPKISATSSVTFPKCMPEVLAGYGLDDIFSVGEFGLFYSLVPETRMTKSQRREFYTGNTNSDRRLTVLLATNMSGTEKLPILVVGRSSVSSRSFRGVHTLSASYRKDKSARMTAAIFEEWVRQHDEVFYRSHRNVVMIVEKNPAHPPLSDLKAIILVFLPQSSTEKIKPLEEGIIRQLKIYYKWGLLEKMSDCIRDRKNFTIPLPDALYRLRLSWVAVSSDIITKAFSSCGFSSLSYAKPASECIINSPPLEELKENGLDMEDFNACVSADDNLATMSSLVSSDIESPDGSEDASVHMFPEGGGASECTDASDISETEPMSQYVPDAFQMRAAFWTIQSYLQACPHAENMLAHLADIQAVVQHKCRTSRDTCNNNKTSVKFPEC
ncbi:tigger transposable element-derived protein 4-like [Cherax quadricarinatus]|uniref:tigger transposable element-derived protein 4-like n=1 Tax=Cherax quadricarinatus TaxID=27406 RepID=UPI00387E9C7A